MHAAKHYTYFKGRYFLYESLVFFEYFWWDCLWIMVTLHPVEGAGLAQSVGV